MSGKRLFKSVVGLALVLVALCVGVGFYAKWQASRSRRNAESLLAELRRMKVGETTSEEVQRLVRIQRPAVSEDTPFCKDEFCTYNFGYETYSSALTYLFATLHPWQLYLAPKPAGFDVNLDVRQNRLVRTRMSLSSDWMPRTFMATVDDEVPDISPVNEPYHLDDSRPLVTVIYVKPNATAAQREYAYSFNLKCLDRLGGCRDKGQLFQSPR